MRLTLFGKDLYITKRWKQDLSRWSLYYRTELVISILSFVIGFVLGSWIN